METIRLAYSPDTDDAFMVYAMREGLVDTSSYKIDYISDDIQALNEKALTGDYDITAISVAAYPSIRDQYWLIPIGASVGDRFGPAIITKPESPIQNTKDLAGKRIAVPGLHTSAYFAAKILFGDFEPVPLRFDAISEAVAAGEVDAGILIHELQLNCQAHGFKKLGDLGTLWFERTGWPLPLGANAIKKSLGRTEATALARMYEASVQYGLAHKADTIRAASSQATITLEPELSERYIAMYVNEDSLTLRPAVRAAMVFMFQEAGRLGLCEPVDIENDLLPLSD